MRKMTKGENNACYCCDEKYLSGGKLMETYIDCISVENMRESDRLTIERYVTGRTLMYRAALGVYRAVSWHGDIAIAVGGGNNGGDGYALACILANENIPCRIVTLSEKLTDDSTFFAEKANALGVPKETYTTENLTELRKQIDECDDNLIQELSKRMRVAREIGVFKKEHNMTVLQTGRYSEILDKRGSQGALCGISPMCVRKIFEAIHEESVRQQLEILNM